MCRTPRFRSLVSFLAAIQVAWLACSLFPASAFAQVFTVGVRLDVATATGPRAVQVADLNADGKLDLVTANGGSNSVSILLGAGGGAYLPRTDIATAGNAQAVAIDDVNGDGKLDLAVACYAANVVSLMLGNGAGGFGPRTDFATGSQPQFVKIADVNNDGRPDLITADGGSSTVSVLLGNGSGGFAPRVGYPTAFNAFMVQAADLNSDGNLDLAVADYGASSISVLLGNGAGGFGAKTDFATGSTTSSVVVADLNNDGKVDLLATDQNAKAISVLLGNGLGSFAAKTDFPVNGGPATAVVADLNNDGKLDVATTNYDSASVTVLAGDGAGGFGGRVDIPLATNPWGLATGDVNGDGSRDLVAAALFSNAAVLLLQPARFAAKVDSPTGVGPRWAGVADVDGDGDGDVATANTSGSLSVFLSDGAGGLGARNDYVWGGNLQTVAFGDLNTDGMTDFVLPNYNGNQVLELLGNGKGGWLGYGSFAAGTNPQYATVGDVTGDGRPDLLVANSASNNLSVLAGAGGGSFSPKVDYNTGFNPMAIALGDLNGDGKLDAVVTNYYANTVSVMLNDGFGGFPPPHTDLVTGSFPAGVALGQFNSDTRLDIVVANQSSNTVSFFPGVGPGTFGGRTDFATAASPFGIVATDVNGDGRTDVVTGNAFNNSVGVLLGNGLGGFGLHSEYPAGPSSYSIAVGDLNRDGRPDLVTANQAANTTSVLLALQLTRTSLTVSPSPCVLGAPLTLQASVSSLVGSGSPADSVRFYDGTTLLGIAPVVNGVAGLSLFAPRLGLRAFSAVYKGGGKFAPSESSPANVRVVASANPTIASIQDVGSDQGQQVRLRFRASGFDYRGSATPIVGYDVYRKMVAGLAPAQAPSSPHIRSDATKPQVDGWDFVASITARTDSAYVIVVPTLADSNASGIHRVTLFVSAATETPATYYDSAPDSGYSVDNLPPVAPAPFAGDYVSSATHLHWGANSESDLWYYALYRGSSADFTPDASSFVATVSDTSYVDPGDAGSWYKLAAVDINGNVSGYAVLGPGQTTDVGDNGAFALSFDGTLPNPVVGSRVQVHFVLPDAKPARIEAFDVAGRRVAWRDVGTLGPGRHTVELSWNKRHGAGVYLLRLSHGSDQLSRRITALN